MPRHRDNAHAHDPGATSEEANSGEANQTPRHPAAVGGPPAAAMQTNGHADPASSSTSASTTVGEAHTAVTGRPPVAAMPTTHGHADPVGPSSPLASASTGEANRQRRQFEDVFRPFDFDDSNNSTSRFNAEFRDRTPRRRPSTVWAGYHSVLNASDEFQREAISNGIRELVKDRFLNKRVALMQLRSYGLASRPAPPPSASPAQKPSAHLSPSAADAAASATTPVVVDTGVLDSTSVPYSRTAGDTTTPPALDASEAAQPSPRHRTRSSPEASRDYSLVWNYGRDLEDDETTTNLCGVLKRIPRRHRSKEVQKEATEEPKPLVEVSPAPSRRTRNQRQVSMVPHQPKSKAAAKNKKQRKEESEATDPDSLFGADPAPRQRTRSSPETSRDFSLIWNYGHEVDEDEDTANYCRIMKAIPRRRRSKKSQGEATKAQEASIEDVLNETVERLGNTSISEKKPASHVHVDTPPPPTEAPAQPAGSSVSDDSTTQKLVTKVVQIVAKEVAEYSIEDTVESLAQISLSESGVNSAVIEGQHSANNEDPLESTQSPNETVDVEMPSVADESGTQEVVPLSRDTRSMPQTVTKEVKGDENEVKADTIDGTVATFTQINISENGVNSVVNEEQPSARSEPCLDSTQSSDDVDMSATSDKRGAQQFVPSSLETIAIPQIQPDPPVSVEERVLGRDEANVEIKVAETPQVERPVSSILEQPNRVVDPLYQRQHEPLIARRQSRTTLMSRLSQGQHQRQTGISAVHQPMRSHAESPKNVKSEEKQEVVAAPSASSPQKSKNELQGQFKPAVTQKGPHHRPSQKQQAKARKPTTRLSREVESSPKAPVSQPPATSNLQQLNEKATSATVPQRTDEALRPIQKSVSEEVDRVDGPECGFETAPANDVIGREKPETRQFEKSPAKNDETEHVKRPTDRDTALPMPSKEPRSSKKPKTSAKETIKRGKVRRSREKNEGSSQKSPHQAETRKSTIRKPHKNAKEAEKAAKTAQKRPKQANPQAVPAVHGASKQPNQKNADSPTTQRQSRLFMVSKLPRFVPSPRNGSEGKLRFSLISKEQRRRMSMNTRRSTKSPNQPSIPVPQAPVPAMNASVFPEAEPGSSEPVKSPQPQPKESTKKESTKTTTPETALLPRLRTEVWRDLLRSGVLRFPEQQGSANVSLPISANDLSNALRKREAEEFEAKEPIKGRTVRRSREKNEGSSQKSLHRVQARKSTIRKPRKNAKEAEKAAKTAQKRPTEAIPQAISVGNSDSNQPNQKNADSPTTQRQSRMFMVSRLPRFVPSPRNGSQGKLRFSLISKEQRRRMSMNTRRSTNLPNQPSIPVRQAPVPAMNASVNPEAQPGPSEPAKSAQPQPKESKKKASTKTTTPETALLPRLRTEVWRDLLRSGALRFPKQQESANESLPISANDLSNALRKREAEECEARSPPSEASPDSSIAKPADGEESVDKGNESTTKAPQKSPVKSPEKPVTSPKKPPTPTVPLPSGATDDRKKAAPGDEATDKPFKPKRKRSSDSDSDKAPVRRPRLDVPIPAVDDKSKNESAEPLKKPTESDDGHEDVVKPSEETSDDSTMVKGKAQPPLAEIPTEESPQEPDGEVSDHQSDEEPQEPAEAMEPIDVPQEDGPMDAFFDVPPPDDLDPRSELENDAASEAHEAGSTVDLESSEVGSVNGSEVSEVGSLIASEASESGSNESGSERSESPGPSTRPSRKRKAPNTNDGPSARRRPPQSDSDSDEAPQPRSSNRRARQPRNPPTFGHLEHIQDIEGVDLPNAPPVVVRQREVVDNVRLTADQQIEVLRGNDVTIARYESGAVVMQGRFNGGSTASQLMRDALRQPQVLFNDPEDRIVQMALGNEHLIMRSISGDIYTVGRATEGQLGVARHRFYRQSSVTPQTMRRIVLDDEGRDVFFTDIRAEGNVTIAITRDGTEYRCGEGYGPMLAKPRRQ